MTIDRLVVEKQDESLREQFRALISERLHITKRYTQMLNNNVQPSLEELSTIAQILGVTTDELIVLA